MKFFNDNILQNKKIMITGASSGIGESTAIKYSQYGAKLILLSRNKEKLNKIMKRLHNKETHTLIECDISCDDEAFNVITNLSEENLPLDGAFHAAGSELVKPIGLIKNKDFKDNFSSSVSSAISMSRAFFKSKVMNNHSSVIFMSSIAAITGTSGLSAYSASKSALIGLTKSLAIEFSNRKIRFNTILSGAVKTPMHERILDRLSLDAKVEYEAKHPLGFGSPEDISSLATFLMCDASKWITGTSICIDGGFAAK